MDYTKLDFDHKLEIVTNSIFRNLALDALSEITGKLKDDWCSALARKAIALANHLSEAEIEEHIKRLEKMRIDSEDGQSLYLKHRLMS